MTKSGHRKIVGWLSMSLFAGSMGSVPFPSIAADFYAGKQLRLIVGADAGGAFDLYARALSRHLGKHIPGNPIVIVQNMPGAASIKATNYIYNVAPRDGTVIGGVFPGIPTSPLTAPSDTQYDPNKLLWVGSATKELYVGYVWSTAPAKSMEAIKSTEVLMGGSSVGTYSIDMAILANEFFGTKFKVVTGYKSGAETQLAIERGEVHGVMATAWSMLKQKATDWMAQKKVTVIVQYGTKRDPRFPDVPSYIEFAKSDEQRQAITFMNARLEHGKPYLAPPEVPADRLAILRRAFSLTMKDGDFLKDIEASNIEIDAPMDGADLQKFAAEEAGTPPTVVKKVNEILARYSSEMR